MYRMIAATSNAQGIAEFSAIPPGNYRWRASAASHQDASGRLTVYPGVTANERVFLDYQVVSIEFSVTETTIKDEYAIVLEAIYQTQVPAPVVLLEPMSISLPALQQGEEHTGELTLSNYGLVRADNLQYALPASDANYKYEYFGQLPTQLAAKSRVSIPYRITALQALKSGVALNLAPAHKLEQLTSGKPPQPAGPVQNAIRAFLRTGDSQVIDKTASSAATVQAAAKAAGQCRHSRALRRHIHPTTATASQANMVICKPLMLTRCATPVVRNTCQSALAMAA